MPSQSPLDEMNLGIIAALQEDPTVTNKVLGDQLGVSEVTIAARIRSLKEHKVLRVMMQRDVRSLGYEMMALIDINVEGRRPEDVARELALIEDCASVSVTMSSPDIIIHVNAADGYDLQSIIEYKIAPIAGIISYEVLSALDVIKMDTRYGVLDAG